MCGSGSTDADLAAASSSRICGQGGGPIQEPAPPAGSGLAANPGFTTGVWHLQVSIPAF